MPEQPDFERARQLIKELKGKSIVITGGSSGIGAELVRQAVDAGAGVCFTYNQNKHAALKLLDEMRSRGQRRIWITQLDQRDASTVERFVNEISFNSMTADFLVANAGVELSGGLEKHTAEEIHRIVDTNLTGNLCLLRELITKEIIREQIAVVGSIAADGNHDQLAYSAAKAGLRGAVESLSRYDEDVKKQGLGVKLIEPVFVRTPMAERYLRVIERRVKRKGGDALVDEFRREAVMDVGRAALEILYLTTNPEVIGVRTIPEGANLHAIRKKYF
jgi:3-oxoacyl-[acyl-carrier protein] reductase